MRYVSNDSIFHTRTISMYIKNIEMEKNYVAKHTHTHMHLFIIKIMSMELSSYHDDDHTRVINQHHSIRKTLYDDNLHMDEDESQTHTHTHTQTDDRNLNCGMKRKSNKKNEQKKICSSFSQTRHQRHFTRFL